MLPSKLAFVDIETTGLGVMRDRIIEIGILRVEDNKLVKTFQSLINPQGYVSPFSFELTGISQKELDAAPTFYEVMEDIADILQDCVFVAHNVRFDYSFVRNEFKRYEKSYSSRHFCTVKLSQRLYPTARKHNLDALVERLGISCERRHRAFDDAKVLWDFYQIAQKSFSQDVLERAIKQTFRKPSVPSSLPPTIMDDIPEKPGVYIFYGENRSPLYIGKSVNLRERVMSHFAQDHASTKEMHISQQIRDIETITTSGELGALLKESQLIKEMQPLYNRQLRLLRKLYVLKKKVNEKGYPEVVLETVTDINPDNLADMLGIFRSQRQAKEYLVTLVKEYQLCEKLLGIEKTKGACFAYRLETCKGACVGEENPLAYTMRFVQACSDHAIKPWPFVGPICIREESVLDETAECFVVDKWCLLSMYTASAHSVQEKEMQPYIFDVDTYKLLVRFLEKKQNWKYIRQVKEGEALVPSTMQYSFEAS